MNDQKITANNGLHIDQRTLLAYISILSLWLVTRPYRGIWHDSRLYTLSALKKLYPHNFERDLFFLYGSQDNFTVFSQLHAWVIEYTGIDQSALLLTLTGQALWLTGAIFLACKLLYTPWNWLGLGLIIVMNDYYGYYIFSYGESFLTPRLFAEGLTMIGLYLWLKRYYLFSVIPIAISMAFHPLMTAAAMLILYFTYLLIHRTKTLLITTALITLIGYFVVIDIPPFNRILLRMSDTWYTLVDQRSPHVFLHNWETASFNRMIISFSILVCASRLAIEPLRSLCIGAALATVAGMAFAYFGGEILHNVLVIQIQPWRVLWLTTLLSALAAALLVSHYSNVKNWIPIFGYLSAWLLRDSTGGFIALLSLMYCVYEIKLLPYYRIILLLFFGIFSIATLSQLAVFIFVPLADLTEPSSIIFYLKIPMIAFIVSLATFSLTFYWQRSSRYQTSILALSLFGLALSVIAWNRTISASSNISISNIDLLRNMIKANDVVYWVNNPEDTWFALLRSSYYSRTQLAGILFNEETALEGQRRSQLLGELGAPDTLLSSKDLFPGNNTKTFNGSSLHFPNLILACKDQNLDWIISNEILKNGNVASSFSNNGWFVYRCSEHRE